MLMRRVTFAGVAAVFVATLALLGGLAIGRWSKAKNRNDEHADLRAYTAADATARCILDLVLAREVKFEQGKWTLLNSQELGDLLRTNSLDRSFVDVFGYGDRRSGFFNALGNPFHAAISNGVGEIRVVVKSRGTRAIVEVERDYAW